MPIAQCHKMPMSILVDGDVLCMCNVAPDSRWRERRGRRHGGPLTNPTSTWGCRYSGGSRR
eukprot:1178816-Prorocentrum_minimum.AAC.4